MDSALSSGIFQSDIIIRSMLIKALDDLRKDQSVLDYVFVSLAQDAETSEEYGHKQMAEAKRWFLKTHVHVYHTLSLTAPQFPAITVSMVESQQGDKILADINYDETEDMSDDPVLAGPFVPDSYDPLTGTMVVPVSVGDSVYLAEGLVIQESNGTRHTVTEVLDDYTVTVDGAPGDFNGAKIRYGSAAKKVHLEGCSMKESYLLGVHVNGPPLYLLVLHSIVVFCLLRYNQALLEARGFENMTFGSTDFSRLQVPEIEAAYSRYINVSGIVRQFWPKATEDTVQSVGGAIRPIGSGHYPLEDGGTVDDLSWIGDEDSVG
jgi:hypothetical protein